MSTRLVVKLKRTAVTAWLAFSALHPAISSASDYGCRVLLCLANPKGPMDEQACVPPITQLMRDLNARPARPFPTCEEGAPAYAAPSVRPYEPCPAGFTALEEGRRAIRMSTGEFRSYWPSDADAERQLVLARAMPASVAVGIGEGSMQHAEASAKKVCVQRPVGVVLFSGTQNVDGSAGEPVAVYESITTLDMPVSPRVIDVFIDGRLSNTVRY